MSAELETRGPADPKVRDRWVLRSGESWQDDLGTPVELRVHSTIGERAHIGLTLADAIELRAQLDQHITNVTPAPVPKTREEQAAFAQAWDAKVDASRGAVKPQEPPQPMWQGDREYQQAQWDHARTPERYGGGLG